MPRISPFLSLFMGASKEPGLFSKISLSTCYRNRTQASVIFRDGSNVRPSMKTVKIIK
jgi:hypothetical protein